MDAGSAIDSHEAVHDGIRIRRIGPSDLPGIVDAFSDPEIALWNPRPTSESGPTVAAARWLRTQRDLSSGKHVTWAICLDTDPTFLGSVSIHHINRFQRTGELGYWLLDGARGSGVATRAVAATVRLGIMELGLYRLQLTHAINNQASCRVAEKVGFRLEGTLRQSCIYGDRLRHDEHVHGLLRSDLFG